MYKKILFILVIMSQVFAITFPIDLEYCKLRYGRILLTGWYSEDRDYGKHRAIDIPANIGTPVKAVLAGKVIEKNFEYRSADKTQCFGNYIVIQDDSGKRWYYAHLSSYDVKLNEVIAEGQVIGTVGYTGLGTKPVAHLHLECRDINNNKLNFSVELGRAVKPLIPDQKSKWAFSLRR